MKKTREEINKFQEFCIVCSLMMHKIGIRTNSSCDPGINTQEFRWTT
jgi:hypothetical protein